MPKKEAATEEDISCTQCGDSGTYREERGADQEPWLNYCPCLIGQNLCKENNTNDNVKSN